MNNNLNFEAVKGYHLNLRKLNDDQTKFINENLIKDSRDFAENNYLFHYGYSNPNNEYRFFNFTCFSFGQISEEISFDEFVDKLNIPKPEYDPKDVAFKPVGYKFKYEKIKNIVTAFLGDIKVYKTDSYDFPLKSSVYQELKELQVLDLWCDKILFEKETPFSVLCDVAEELQKESESITITRHKQIIGYKLIKPEYKEAAEIIAYNHIPNLTNRSFIYQNGSCFTENCKVKDNLEEAGVMHWFEEVYEKESITLKSGVKLSEDDIAEVKELIEIIQVCKDLAK